MRLSLRGGGAGPRPGQAPPDAADDETDDEGDEAMTLTNEQLQQAEVELMEGVTTQGPQMDVLA